MHDAPRTALAQLERSHHRHDERLAALVALAEQVCGAHGGPSDLDDLAQLCAWFARSVPRHFADEDDAVFPRLAAAHPQHAAALAALSAEHPALIAAHAAVAAHVSRWAPSSDHAPFLAAVAALAERYRDHARREDALLAGLALAPADDAAALALMDAHRGR